jgi:SAM-dependent methyltransferase
LRGLIALLSEELFGAQLPLSDFPELKGLRVFGMSDPPNLAAQLEKKFDYTNTFYHQPPTIDIVHPDEREWGRYDFIISSEVMEHVPPPVENAFANLHRLLKPSGLLLLTVPYGINMQPKEHFPELHEHTLASLGGKTVLVNRRRDGSIETFEDLCFHGGDGSTLELRVFTEDKLKAILTGAGFNEVHIASQNVPEFGVEHNESWSLPIVARKGTIGAPVTELARAYRAARQRQRELDRELTSIQGEYQRYIAAHDAYAKDMEHQLAERLEWARQNEQLSEERTQWALKLDEESKALVAHLKQMDAEYKTLVGQMEQAKADIEQAQAETERARAEKDQLEARKWIRLGRRLGTL